MGALALAMVAAIIIACTKEKGTIVSQSASETITVSKEDDMSAYLKQFKEKMQSYDMSNVYMLAVPIGYHLAFHQYTFEYAQANCGGGGNYD